MCTAHSGGPDPNAWMGAEILSDARLRGLSAGVSVEGTTLRPGDDENEQVNGHAMQAKEIVRVEPMVAPATGCHYVDVLEKGAPRNESKKAASVKKQDSSAW